MDEFSVCHHTAEFSVAVSIGSTNSPTDVFNFYEMLEIGKLWKLPMSVFSTQ